MANTQQEYDAKAKVAKIMDKNARKREIARTTAYTTYLNVCSLAIPGLLGNEHKEGAWEYYCIHEQKLTQQELEDKQNQIYNEVKYELLFRVEDMRTRIFPEGSHESQEAVYVYW